MPKAPKSPSSRNRHNPLYQDVTAEGPLREASRHKRDKSGADDADGEQFIGTKQSKRILQIGRELAEEDEKEKDKAVDSSTSAFAFDSRPEFGDDREEDIDEADAWGDEDDVAEEVEVGI
jgi:essential nuclear protein 1